jgi:hypothetical protein
LIWSIFAKSIKEIRKQKKGKGEKKKKKGLGNSSGPATVSARGPLTPVYQNGTQSPSLPG